MMENSGFHTIYSNVICFYWTCDLMLRLVMFNQILLCTDSIIFLYWIGLIRSSLTTWSNYFSFVYLSEFSLIPYSLFLLIIQNPIFFPSPPLKIWRKTLPTIFPRIWFIRPRPHSKYLRTIYHNIPGIFNYSGPFKV